MFLDSNDMQLVKADLNAAEVSFKILNFEKIMTFIDNAKLKNLLALRKVEVDYDKSAAILSFKQLKTFSIYSSLSLYRELSRTLISCVLIDPVMREAIAWTDLNMLKSFKLSTKQQEILDQSVLGKHFQKPLL